MLQLAPVASALLHSERRTLHRARGMFCLHRAALRVSRVQSRGGGVLSMIGGSAKFESVAISDTSAEFVRVAWRGRSGREAEWGGGMQYAGAVFMVDGSVEFKGGSIARSKAVRDPRC